MSYGAAYAGTWPGSLLHRAAAESFGVSILQSIVRRADEAIR